MDPILLALQEYASSLERSDWSVYGDAGPRYAQRLAGRIRRYVQDNRELDLKEFDRAATFEHLNNMGGALSRADLFDAYRYTQAMIGSLPGPPVSLPTPPWKR